MLKHSVQIELFLILWVTKLIYSESPMYTVLDKDTIKNEILPHLSKAKRGYVTQSVSTQFRASPFERALFSALNRVLLIN